MITFSTDNRMPRNQSSFHLVFFKVDGVPLRYTELSAEQQVEANKIYPVTFEAREQLRQSSEAAKQSVQ